MKTVNKQYFYFLILFVCAGFLFTSCNDEKEDPRPYEAVTIAAAYVNGEMISSNNLVSTPEKTIITMPAGTDISALKVRLVPLNGELINFSTDVPTDYSHPMDIKIKSYNGMDVNMNLHIVSRPLLTNLFVEGLSIPKENIFFGESSVIVQVPTGTNLSALKISMEFRNGTLMDFQNGAAQNYNTPVNFNVKGVDNTVYSYQLMLTDQEVGPASIQSVKANDAESALIEMDGNNVQVYFKTLTNFAQASLSITTGYGNELVEFTNGETVNLFNSPKIKVRGTDGILKEFTFLKPKLKPTELFRKTPADMGFGADGGASLCFSGDYIVASTHNGTAGIHYYDLNGTRVGTLKLPTGVDWGAIMGLRKIASDDNGAIIGVSLAAGGSINTAYNIYKWNSVTDENPTVLCSFTASELGLTATRTNGVNIQGSLSGNAIITVPITTSKVVLKWTVSGGAIVNAKPETIALENGSNFSNYASVEAYPGNSSIMVGGIATSDYSGLRSYNGSAIGFNVSGSTTDLRMKKIDGRVYLVHSIWGNARHTFALRDITDNDDASYKYNMLGSDAIIATASNGNATNDADIAYVKGKLHAAFLGTNGGVVCYVLE